MTTPARRSAPGAIVLAVAATILGGLPLWMTGALAVQLSEDLAFGVAALGLGVAVVRATSAASSVHLGRLADRLGATRSLRLAALLGAVVCVGIGATAFNWLSLVAWLMLSSAVGALAQPASNRLMVNRIRPDRLGIAFGVKQSSAPMGAMLAGLSVPLVALTLGWRWAYLFVGLFAICVALAARPAPASASRVPQASTTHAAPADRATLVVFAAAFGLGTAASSSIPTFYVTAAVASGSSAQLAGYMLALASVGAIATRLVAGFASDRIRGGHLRLCAGLVATGSLGLALLASGNATAMAIGVVVGLAGVWGYNGVFWFALVQAHPQSPGKVTGQVAPGGFIGGTIGPLLFGLAAERVGYSFAWSYTLVIALLAAATMLWGGRRLGRHAVAVDRGGTGQQE